MKKSLSIILSFIFLISHLYLTVGTHFCNGKIVETKVVSGSTGIGCGMIEMDEAHSVLLKNHVEESLQTVPCCENEYHILQASGEFKKETTQADINMSFAMVFIYLTLNPQLSADSDNTLYTHYTPPLFEKDVQTLFQTFLC